MPDYTYWLSRNRIHAYDNEYTEPQKKRRTKIQFSILLTFMK